MPKLEIRIGKAVIKVEGHGFQGQGCMDEASKALAQMGIDAQAVKKAEYYQDNENATSRNLNQGT